jgi:hypothetical protein
VARGEKNASRCSRVARTHHRPTGVMQIANVNSRKAREGLMPLARLATNLPFVEERGSPCLEPWRSTRQGAAGAAATLPGTCGREAFAWAPRATPKFLESACTETSNDSHIRALPLGLSRVTMRSCAPRRPHLVFRVELGSFSNCGKTCRVQVVLVFPIVWPTVCSTLPQLGLFGPRNRECGVTRGTGGD